MSTGNSIWIEFNVLIFFLGILISYMLFIISFSSLFSKKQQNSTTGDPGLFTDPHSDFHLAWCWSFPYSVFLFPDVCSKIGSIPVSFFTSVYGVKWKEFFPDKDLKSTPSFDACTICFSSADVVRDYLAGRQADCE